MTVLVLVAVNSSGQAAVLRKMLIRSMSPTLCDKWKWSSASAAVQHMTQGHLTAFGQGDGTTAMGPWAWFSMACRTEPGPGEPGWLVCLPMTTRSG